VPNAHSIEESTPTRPTAQAQNQVAERERAKRLAAARARETTQTSSTPQIAPQAGPNYPNGSIFDQQGSNDNQVEQIVPSMSSITSIPQPPKKRGRPSGSFSMNVLTKQQLHKREVYQASRARKVAAKLAELESGPSNSSGDWRKENQVDVAIQIDSFLPMIHKASPGSRTGIFGGPRNIESRLEGTLQTRSTQPIPLQPNPGSSRTLPTRKNRVWVAMEPPQVLNLPCSKDRIGDTMQTPSVPPTALHPGLSCPRVGYFDRPSSNEHDLEGTMQTSPTSTFMLQSSLGSPRVGIFDRSPNQVDRIEETLQSRSRVPIELQPGPVNSHIGCFAHPVGKENQREALQTRSLPPNELLTGPSSPITGHLDESHDKENQMKGTRKTRSSAQAKATNLLTSRLVAQSNAKLKLNVSSIYII
jgi:hypothetical protein